MVEERRIWSTRTERREEGNGSGKIKLIFWNVSGLNNEEKGF